jgi:ATP-dependent helicase HrpA
MLEILNIKEQLEDILSEMNIPLQSGGKLEHYLCAISKGLIQFVCSRSHKGSYRSLTADQIYIHPGSVMYQKTPRYIVAGEIVKTSRIYARSVSELDSNWLPTISPVLRSLMDDKSRRFAEQKEQRDGGGKKDFTNQIRIGDTVFPVKMEKDRKKIVVFTWDKLKALVANLDRATLPDFKDLKGKVMFDHLEILYGMKVATILQIADKIDPSQGILQHWPKETFSLTARRERLFTYLDKILSVCRKHKKTKKAGFLALCTDGKGNYWFKCAKSFNAALTESLASLEALADEPEDYIGRDELARVNGIYHKLSQIILE